MPELKADWENHHIEGYARAAIESGQHGKFSAPLLSHITGNLWTGGCIHGVNLKSQFKHIVSLYPWEKYTFDSTATSRTEVVMYDSNELSGAIAEVVDLAINNVNDGPTLIHCQAGLNRSGLIAAMVLRSQGMTSREAIDLLREKRSPMVLCNQTFENYLLGLDD